MVTYFYVLQLIFTENSKNTVKLYHEFYWLHMVTVDCHSSSVC